VLCPQIPHSNANVKLDLTPNLSTTLDYLHLPPIQFEATNPIYFSLRMLMTHVKNVNTYGPQRYVHYIRWGLL
jgi:hypothetical protein